MTSYGQIVRVTKAALASKQLPSEMATYEALINEAEPLFELDNKNLETAVKNHAKDLMFYDSTLQECKTIEATVTAHLEEVESKLFQQLTSVGHGQRAVGTREAPQYIKGNKEYVEVYELLLQVQYTRKRLEAIVEALKSMAYSLNNIVKIRVAQLEHVTL